MTLMTLPHAASLTHARMHACALPPAPQYLRSKGRAGMVALPALAPSGVRRALYLVPPSEEVCRQLGVAWHTCSDCLLALVVPMAGPR